MSNKKIDSIYNYFYQINIELKNTSPLRIGTGEDNGFLVNRENKSLIFGSSICGSVKDFLIKLDEKNTVEKYFGYTKIEEKNGEKKEKHIESKIYFSDMISNEKVDNRLTERDGIRVSNEFGSTLDKGKYKVNFLKEKFNFKFTIKLFLKDEDKNDFKKLIKSLLNGIDNQQVLFGADKTKGFGNFSVEKAEFIEFDLEKNMKEYLNFNILNEKVEFKSFEYKDGKILKERYETIKFTGKIKDSLLLKGEEKDISYKDSNGKDKTKKVQYPYEEGEKNYIIPSGTIKGSMRSYFGKILNSLNGEVKNNFKHYDEEKRKEEKPMEYKEIIELLGHNANPNINNKKYQMGKLLVDDVVIDVTSKTEYHRIKIDRFTGGVINGALLTENRITGGDFEIKIRTREPLNPEEKALLFLYFRDLGLGKITLGSNASVGSGRVEGKKLSFDNVNIDFENINNLNRDNKDKINSYIEALSEVKA